MKNFLIRIAVLLSMFIIALTPVYAAEGQNGEEPAKVQNVRAEGYTYNSIKVSWDKVDNAIGYSILRVNGIDTNLNILYEGMSESVFYWKYTNITEYSVGTESVWEPVIEKIDIKDGDTTSYIDKVSDIKWYSSYMFYYKVAPVFEDHIGEYNDFPASAKTIDVSSSDSAPETSGPVIDSIEYTNQVYSPGLARLKFTAEDDSGIEYIRFFGSVVNYKAHRVSLPAGKHEFDLIMPVSETWNYRNENFTIYLQDKYGNCSVFEGPVFAPGKYYTEMVKEFDVEFVGALSNTNVPSQLEYMDEGKTVELIIDEKSNGILHKECLDAIKGKDKTIVVKTDDSGAMQWIFYGKSINNDTKDLDITTSFEAINGSDYGATGNILRIDFADNGQLPGIVNYRIKSNYIQEMYDLNSETMYLYNLNGSDVSLESSECYVIANGDSSWCYFDMTHNSSYILSSTKLHSKMPEIKPPESTEAEKAAAEVEKVGDTVKYNKNTYKVTSVKNKTVAFSKGKNVKSLLVPATIKVKGVTYKVTSINAKAFTARKIRSVTIGKNVKNIKAKAFYGSKATTVTLKTKLLKKLYVKNALKSSKVKTVKVKITKKASKTNTTYVKKYKKYFTKSNAGRKVTVK